MSSVADIEKILSDMRMAIDEGKFQPIPRRKNLNTLAQIGITWSDAKDELYGLSASDYFKGPEVDRDFPSSDLFWMFKKNIDGQVIYIKFKVLYLEDGSVKLVSFHISQP